MTESEAKLWTGERGQAAIEIIGLPEWRIGEGLRCRLMYSEESAQWLCVFRNHTMQRWEGVCRGECGSMRDEYEASCILNEHARAWLAERDVRILFHPANTITMKGTPHWHWEDLRKNCGFNSTEHDTYTEAVISAVVAVGQEKKE